WLKGPEQENKGGYCRAMQQRCHVQTLLVKNGSGNFACEPCDTRRKQGRSRSCYLVFCKSGRIAHPADKLGRFKSHARKPLSPARQKHTKPIYWLSMLLRSQAL